MCPNSVDSVCRWEVPEVSSVWGCACVKVFGCIWGLQVAGVSRRVCVSVDGMERESSNEGFFWDSVRGGPGRGGPQDDNCAGLLVDAAGSVVEEMAVSSGMADVRSNPGCRETRWRIRGGCMNCLVVGSRRKKPDRRYRRFGRADWASVLDKLREYWGEVVFETFRLVRVSFPEVFGLEA